MRNILVKSLVLFVLLNLIFWALYPMSALGRISVYNLLIPGRLRLPYGENPERSYNLSLYNLEAMFASHILAGEKKPPDEYRVILIGDSATWGYLLENQNTLAGEINAAGAILPDGRKIRVYNLGYPVMSLAKDLLILKYAMRYQPDLIVWPMTLESLPYDKQLYPPLLQNNTALVKQLVNEYNLNFYTTELAKSDPKFLERTIIGARRSLADLIRLQLYGMMWAATGIDQDIPEKFVPRQEDLSTDLTFHGLQPAHLDEKDLAIDVIAAGLRMAGSTPVMIINEPMFISQGKNSDIRYNFYYPRWAYDDYRKLMETKSQQQDWHYLDLWDTIPPSEFTNTAVHLSPRGSKIYASNVLKAILELARK